MRFFSDELHEKTWPSVFGRPWRRRLLFFILTIATLGIDYATGPCVRFPVFYAPLILLVAWYEGLLWGSLAGVSMILARLLLELTIWPIVPWPARDSYITASSAMVMIIIVVWYCARAGQLTREIRLLRGLLPVCMYCHRIRNDKDHWERFERYIMTRSQAEFSHGICPYCVAQRAAAGLNRES